MISEWLTVIEQVHAGQSIGMFMAHGISAESLLLARAQLVTVDVETRCHPNWVAKAHTIMWSGNAVLRGTSLRCHSSEAAEPESDGDTNQQAQVE